MAFVGLAKNSGKTTSLKRLIGELASRGRPFAITSIGRDGEAADVLQPQLAKPRIRCPESTLVATTAPLLARDGSRHELLERTGFATPLGEVVVARLVNSAEIEIAGPSTAEGIRAVTERMLTLGAEAALIDGSIDRRAASSPSVADAVVLATGAVLGQGVEEVAERTRVALALIDLPQVKDSELLKSAANHAGDLLLDRDGVVRALPSRFALTADRHSIAAAAASIHGRPTFFLRGMLSQRFLDQMPADSRVVVVDPTRVFLSGDSPRRHEQRGIRIEVLERVKLAAITVNPVAPLSHTLKSEDLRGAIAEVAPPVPVLDVESTSYPEEFSGPGAAAPAGTPAPR